MDFGHKYTDEELKRLERKFKKVYKQAEKEASEKLQTHLQKFADKDAVMRARLASGEVTAKQYKDWRAMQMMTGKRWEDIRDDIANRYANARKEALIATNASLVDVFAENVNYSTYTLESFTGVNTSFALYNRTTVGRLVRDNPNLLPLKEVDGKNFTTKVVRWNQQKVSSAVAQGILIGEGSKKIAKRLRQVTGMNYRSAVLNARTALTAAECAGKLESYRRGAEYGIDTKKQWIATHDGRTRHTHRQVDRQVVPLNETFGNGCEYPADPLAEPAETYNCRCSMIPVVDGQALDMSQSNTATGQTYEEWKNDRAFYEPRNTVDPIKQIPLEKWKK